MAKQPVTKTTACGSNVSAGVLVAETAADASLLNYFVASGNDLLLIHNTDTNPHTYTVTSVVDPFNRLGDITTQSIAAGVIHHIGPMKQTGWMQTNGQIYIASDSALVKFAVIQLP